MYILIYLKWTTNKDPLYITMLCSMQCGSLDGRGVWGGTDTCIRMVESFCFPPETITNIVNQLNPNTKIKVFLKGWRKLVETSSSN